MPLTATKQVSVVPRVCSAATHRPAFPRMHQLYEPVYTYTGTNRTLSAAVNAVQPHSSICSTCSSNPALTSAFMGHSGGTTPSLQDLINWRAGVDVQDEDTDGVSTDARRSMADPLHTKPVLVTYGATDADPDITLFMATNDGSLHAIDVDDGTEVFTFIPPEEMLETETNFNNIPTGEKEYGLDGNITLFHQDINGDGILNGSDKYILIVGQRRGGTRYYALDITDRANPVYLWSVLGGPRRCDSQYKRRDQLHPRARADLEYP